MRTLIVLCSIAWLSACGLGETATSAATVAKLKAQEAEQARDIQQKVAADLEKAGGQAAQRLQAAESDAK